MNKEILAFMPTFAPDAGEEDGCGRPLVRLDMDSIAQRINVLGMKSRARPWMYMDAIDSVINQRPDVDLIVADARSSEVVRNNLAIHHRQAGGYELAFYPDKASQWAIMNDILARHVTPHTKWVVYTSSDIIWPMDWIEPALKEFEKDPELAILFPTVNAGDGNLPLQLAPGPYDADVIDPADYMNNPASQAARAPCLNMYAAIFHIDFFKTYGGYMNAYANCFTESFLYYQCEAMGCKMRLAPRCWLYHHNGGDIHGLGTENGGYNYFKEKPTFDKMMDEVQLARSENRMTVEFLKKVLYV